jgi:hypothetical protein
MQQQLHTYHVLETLLHLWLCLLDCCPAVVAVGNAACCPAAVLLLLHQHHCCPTAAAASASWSCNRGSLLATAACSALRLYRQSQDAVPVQQLLPLASCGPQHHHLQQHPEADHCQGLMTHHPLHHTKTRHQSKCRLLAGRTPWILPVQLELGQLDCHYQHWQYQQPQQRMQSASCSCHAVFVLLLEL